MSDPVNYLTTDTDLKSVADKIRSKTGGNTPISYPTGFNTEIEKLTDTAIASGGAAAGDILSGKKAYVNKSLVQGNIPSLGATPYYTSSSDQTISAGKYLSGAQTIYAVTTQNIDAANIKSGVTIKVGDAGDAGRIKSVTGTYSQSISSTQATGSATGNGTGRTVYSVTINAPSGYSGLNSGLESISNYYSQIPSNGHITGFSFTRSAASVTITLTLGTQVVVPNGATAFKATVNFFKVS